MRGQRIVIYEPVRKSDPEDVKYRGPLWLAVIALLLVSWGLSWTWREAEAVIRHPFEAPFYALVVLAIFMLVKGLFVWGAWRILCRLVGAGCTLFPALADLVCGPLRTIRDCLSGMRK